MAPIWAFLFVIFAFPGIAPYCPRKLETITAYRCSSRTEVCCEEQKVLFGVRYIGGKYVPGPFRQDR